MAENNFSCKGQEKAVVMGLGTFLALSLSLDSLFLSIPLIPHKALAAKSGAMLSFFAVSSPQRRWDRFCVFIRRKTTALFPFRDRAVFLK